VLVILSFWIHHQGFEIQHSNPAWFIPMVGNVLIRSPASRTRRRS